MVLKIVKELFYWLLLLCYGLVLLGILLYLRFPVEKFHDFCEGYIERLVPETVCTIASLGYRFPATLVLENVMVRALGDDGVMYEDRQLLLQSQLRNPTSLFFFSGQPFGGTMHGIVKANRKKGVFEFDELSAADIDIKNIPLVSEGLGRKIAGVLSISGKGSLRMNDLSLVDFSAKLGVKDGRLELKRPILQQNEIEVEKADIDLQTDERGLEIGKATFTGPLFTGHFSGHVESGGAVYDGRMDMQGALEVKPQLFSRNPQLSMAVKRMQTQKGDKSLPFRIGGSFNLPTFVFVN